MAIINETKENLTNMRAKEAIEVFGSPEYHELEKTYGKYLFIPYDVPKIVPNNLSKFVQFYYKNAKYADKMQGDIAEDLLGKNRPHNATPYMSIDSCADTNTMIWSKNYVPEVFTMFPELFDQIHDYFPFIERGFMWTMWSSAKDIIAHRDMKSMLDMPIRLRIKLWDNNPQESLSIHTAPIGKQQSRDMPITIPSDTNSFAWNNLRTRHASTYEEPYRKILLISFANYRGRAMQQYTDLLDRSIAKYGEYVIEDHSTTISDYISINNH